MGAFWFPNKSKDTPPQTSREVGGNANLEETHLEGGVHAMLVCIFSVNPTPAASRTKETPNRGMPLRQVQILLRLWGAEKAGHVHHLLPLAASPRFVFPRTCGLTPVVFTRKTWALKPNRGWSENIILWETNRGHLY